MSRVRIAMRAIDPCGEEIADGGLAGAHHAEKDNVLM